MNFQAPIPNFILARYPKGSIFQGFGENMDFYKKNFGFQHGHNGWDIIGAYGSDILATHDGTIAQEGKNPTSGMLDILLRSEPENTVIYETYYGHLSNNEILPIGQKVKAGDVIGKMGNSGPTFYGGQIHTGDPSPDRGGTHLHFQVRKIIKQGGQTIYGDNFDPNLIYNLPTGETMSNVIFVHKAGTQEYGFYIPAGADDPSMGIAALRDKALNFGLDILNPDGTVNFGAAKEITGI